MLKKVAIDLISRNIPSSEYSHNGAWAYLRANQLKHVGIDAKILLNTKDKEDWSNFDEIYLYHSIDYNPLSNILNLYGGMQDANAKLYQRLILEENKNIKFISLDYPMPRYGEMCKYKVTSAKNKDSIPMLWKEINWDILQEKCDSIKDFCLDPGIEIIDNKVIHKWNRITIGDSHSFSVYTPGSLTLRKDGRTLRGVLKKGIEKEITDHGFDFNQLEELTCYWGNIDVRHHLCRESNPIQATKDLLKLYEDKLKSLEKDIELTYLLPIEDESRILPKTGYFQGTPFYGSRAKRQELVKLFNETLSEMSIKNNWKLFSWPTEWYIMDGIDFMHEIMQRPRNVHLARKYFRWDLINDCKNSLLDSRIENKFFVFN